MAHRRRGRILGACQRERHRDSKGSGSRGGSEPAMTTVQLTVQYARHLLTSLTTIAFGMNLN
jgi:hypothetical protein